MIVVSIMIFAGYDGHFYLEPSIREQFAITMNSSGLDVT